MCRFVAYLGRPATLAHVVSEPEHSLVVQSYQPREMTAGTINADGFGVGWYNRTLDPTPCVYTNICPIWSDRNLPGLSKHIASDCIFANVRSATPGQAVDQSNCQPFAYQRFLFMHNGFIENFRTTLMRPIRDALRDEYYSAIGGTTDSEHIFAFLLNGLHGRFTSWQMIAEVVQTTVHQLAVWARQWDVRVALNLALTDGEVVVASRFANSGPAPSLYHICNGSFFPQAVAIASEQLFVDSGWTVTPEGSGIVVDTDLRLHAFPVG